MGDYSQQLAGQVLGSLANLESSVTHQDTVPGFTVMGSFEYCTDIACVGTYGRCSSREESVTSVVIFCHTEFGLFGLECSF